MLRLTRLMYCSLATEIAIICANSNVIILHFLVGTCESSFCVRIESRIESAVRFDFESHFRIESAVYTTHFTANI